MKFCKTCKLDKPLESFKESLNINYKVKRNWRCIECQDKAKENRRIKHNARSKIRHKEGYEQRREYFKERYINKKDKILAQNKVYRDKNKKKIHGWYLDRTKDNTKNRRGENYGPHNNRVCSHCEETKDFTEYTRMSYYAAFGFSYVCKKCQKIKRKLNYPKNKEKSRERCKFYRENKPENFKKSQIKHRRSEKYKIRRNLPERKFIKSASTYIAKLLKDKGLVKLKPTAKYIGCTGEFFKNHILSQFTEGMTVEKYGKGNGKIVLDHYIPCESFDLTKEEEQDVCFHWTNLRPLWWEDNNSKNDKMPDGSRARDTKNNYTLRQKKEMIYSRLKSLNFPYINEYLNSVALQCQMPLQIPVGI